MADVTTTEGPRAPSLADFLDMPGDPGALEEPKPRQETETPAERPQVQEQEPPTPPAAAKGTEPAAQPPAEPADKTPAKLKYKGKEITLEELVESGQLQSLVQTAEKYTELQKKHEATLREQQEREQRAAQEAAARREPLTQTKLLEAYRPVLARTVADGWLSADFVEAYPDEATQMVFYRDIIHDLRNRLESIEGILDQVVTQGTAQSWQRYMGEMFDKVALLEDGAPEGFFATLNEPEMRDGFLGYLKQLKPREEQLIGEGALEFLASQFVAYNKDAYAEALRLSQNRTPKEDAKKRAAGESAAARSGSATVPNEGRPGRGIALDAEIFGAPGT